MKKQVIKSLISTGSYESFVANILDLAKEESSYVCVSNVHMVIEAYRDQSFQHILNNAQIATPDGMPLAKAIKWLYKIDQPRVAGMDLIQDLFKSCEEKKLSIYLYGTTNEVLSKMLSNIKKMYPNLNICGYKSPPFRILSEDEKEDVVNEINTLNPDFVFLALGCPKQERWMSEHKDKIKSCMVGLGGAFEVYSGVKKRSPKWMQDYSLEWLYRLILEPKRLWKRYFVTNSMFIYLFVKQLIFQKNKWECK